MASDKELISSIDLQTLSEIEKLAESHMSPSQISKKLGVNRSAFMRIWRRTDSDIREAYDRGCLAIEAKKAKKLRKQIKAENLTAIQIDDKKQAEAHFEAMKADVFGFEPIEINQRFEQ